MPASGRQLWVNGETLIHVRGGAHMSGYPIGAFSELGLSVEPVRIEPSFIHEPVIPTAYGPQVPSDLQWAMAEVRVHCTLIHYDAEVLDTLLDEAMGGGSVRAVPNIPAIVNPATLLEGYAGERLAPAGRLLGGRRPMYASGNHFFSVHLASPVMEFPWRFRKCTLERRPSVIPLGAGVTQAEVTFRCLPYLNPYRSGGDLRSGGELYEGFLRTKRAEERSSGAVLWDHVSGAGD